MRACNLGALHHRPAAPAGTLGQIAKEALEHRRKLRLDIGQLEELFIQQMAAALAVPLKAVALRGVAPALDHEPDTGPRAASMAKAYAGDAGFRVTASALQVHGGIGFTYEHDLHFFLKRAFANAHAFGDSRWHRDRVADLAGV